MGRRTVLLVVAALIAALGTSLVFMYVHGADARASEKYDQVRVLKAVQTISPGETVEAAQAAGKIQPGTVLRKQLLAGAVTDTAALKGQVALTTIFPGEEIITGKFGSAGDQKNLEIPSGKIAISVNLTDPARVAGFVDPGAHVAIFMSGQEQAATSDTGGASATGGGAGEFTRMLLPKVQVLGVGTTTMVPTTTTDQQGAQTTEQLPRTLLTLAVDQGQAEKVLYAAKNGELAFALLSEKSKVGSDTGVTAKNLFK